ncbi:MAG: hypothetical protein UX08_C0003G0039 [Candidatus Collierbacteria bacterium GW2011_GWB1_45_35]|uniref:Ribonuclease P protein component n=2 Tax=Candidatus Collieribacteriota TaxID=1752725 RepID=A0A0G1N0E3_9BACT|nr:MAG: hypothetical protein UW48_C0006G0080 [Microgenomates group bacterium GW2011_GWC1_44_23]KKT86527.1 MAG: hypothetical protein UW84_C0010G0010 [Candidatus Collierbacteria bacterium GW2011_GWA2_44_99]KKT96053.1 MAG: hypothetical protein UW96_C0002G0080 [Candidatus Collierbacteria bacterium GW2011_GWA1_45_15]KKU01073.1 MAG: hypothetical protein UX01_C0002G0039 [Candidatus Collierbacteria bacterium GW2011_GWB2_45_17]KKU05683.1 MAG: hypothetical protein UX08_C0003G0039 [Candidatus Collierbacte
MPLPAINRLPLLFERDRLTKDGHTFHTSHFTIITTPTSLSQGQALKGTNPQGLALMEFPTPRFSILLSKKTAKLAVDRNLIKRRTSALLAELLPQFSVADYLVIPKRSVLDTPHSALLADLASMKFLTKSS